MSKADELKSKNENLFVRNTILLNENERLKKENEKLDKQIDTMLEDCKRCTYRKTSEQLEQAEEIMKKCVHILKHSGTAIEWNDVIEQAEQFLKE